MTTRNYGILAGMIGSALGAWWYRRYRTRNSLALRDRGAVIYDNTPVAIDDAVI